MSSTYTIKVEINGVDITIEDKGSVKISVKRKEWEKSSPRDPFFNNDEYIG